MFTPEPRLGRGSYILVIFCPVAARMFTAQRPDSGGATAPATAKHETFR